MTHFRLPASLLLGLALAACDTAQAPATPAGAASSAALAEAPPPAAPDAAPAFAHADPALFLQPGNQIFGWLCFAEPCDFAVDIAVPAGATWTITELAIEAFFGSATYSFDGFSFDLYADTGGVPAATPLYSRANAAFTTAPTPGSGFPTRTFDLAGPGAPVLPAGTYWIAFDMVNEAVAFRQAFLWRQHLPPVGRPALIGTPSGWAPLAAGDQDLAIHLFGYVLDVDVRPGSADNPITLRERGLLPVAVRTTDAFDAASLDPASITLGDGTGAETPVATRRNGSLMTSLEDVDGDGDLDRVVHVSVPALVASGDLTAATTALVLSAATTGGTPVRGADAVRMVPDAL